MRYHQPMPTATLVSAADAARLLGVTRRTLYAYVSRGMVTSQPGPGPSRARLYSKTTIEALLASRAGSPAERGAAGATDWGKPILESALTLIEGGRLFYRGHDVITLSRHTTIEQVANLLWSGEVADLEMPRTGSSPAGVARGAAVPIMARLEAMLLGSRRSSIASVSSPQPARLRAAATLVAGLFTAAGATGKGSLATRLAAGWGTPDDAVLSAALVLCADHELNASTFTARCVASADARLEHVLLAALCAFQGRRHGGMGQRVGAMFDDVSQMGVARALDRVLSEQHDVPGFGHPLYPDGDPRCVELLRLVPARRGRIDVVSQLQRECAERLDLKPNLDFGLAAVAYRLALPADAGVALFALGRSVGWIAHAFEAWDSGTLIRPRARYTGPMPQSGV